MAKVIKKQTAKHIYNKFSYASEAIEKIRSKKWAEPTGIALGVTASVCEKLNFLPGVSLIGGACRMGSSLLNPDASLADLKEEIAELEKNMECSSAAVKDAIEQKIQALKIEMQKPQRELVKNTDEIKAEVQATAIAISKDMDIIENDISVMKTIVLKTFKMVADTRYREGAEKVEAAYENFLHGSSDLENTFKALDMYIYELQTVARQSLNPKRMQEYLTAILDSGDIELCAQTFNYMLTTRAKYLQISVAYYTFKNNEKRVTQEFECFNTDFHQYQLVYGQIIGTNIEVGKHPSLKLVESCQLQSRLVPAITESTSNDTSGFKEDDKGNLSGRENIHINILIREINHIIRNMSSLNS